MPLFWMMISLEGDEDHERDTRRFAKRQLTWFRADASIVWVENPSKFKPD
jgi:tRNA A37 N6-isopentenylltransferase MiaA